MQEKKLAKEDDDNINQSKLQVADVAAAAVADWVADGSVPDASTILSTAGSK
jgi:hypothetical protein